VGEPDGEAGGAEGMQEYAYLVTARSSTHAEIWEALDRTNAVGSIVSALLSYTLDAHPLNYLTEMISLLRIILWVWPSSRYYVWSNCNLMGKLAHYCLATETAVVAKVLRLYAALGTSVCFMWPWSIDPSQE
jgi:hypothetical protein